MRKAKTYTNEYCASKYTSLEKATMVLTLSIFIHLPVVLQCVFLTNADSLHLKFNGTAYNPVEDETDKFQLNPKKCNSEQFQLNPKKCGSEQFSGTAKPETAKPKDPKDISKCGTPQEIPSICNNLSMSY